MMLTSSRASINRLLRIYQHLQHSAGESASQGLYTKLASSCEPPMVGLSAQQASGVSTKRRRVGEEGPSPVFIVGAARTPLGAFQGALSHLSATELGSAAIRAALERAGVDPGAVGEVFMGNVCSANVGQAPARQAALGAGLPLGTDCTTVNKVCSSGMKAVTLGAQTIALGMHSVVVAGGMESMSNIPHYVPAMRRGARLGDTAIIDGLQRDGLTDAVYNVPMGECAEMCAEKYGISRDAQDAHAVESVARARQATADGTAAWEIVPLERAGGKKFTNGTTPMVTEDESMAKMDPEKLRRLTPYFREEGGTVTAGNASPITDGAAAVVLASAEAVRQFNLPVLGEILGFADAAQDPRDFPTSPAIAAKRALSHAGVDQGDVDFWEINEAFSVVDLVNQKLLGLDPAKVNVLGGSVAIGHPIGASGARLVVTLLNVLRAREGKVGVAAICNGGGGATALVIRRTDSVDA